MNNPGLWAQSRHLSRNGASAVNQPAALHSTSDNCAPHRTARAVNGSGSSVSGELNDGRSLLEVHVDELVAVCESAEHHYFPAARAAASLLGRTVASDRTGASYSAQV